MFFGAANLLIAEAMIVKETELANWIDHQCQQWKRIGYSNSIYVLCVPSNDVPSRAKNPESSSYWSAAQRNGQASHWQSQSGLCLPACF